MLRYLTQNDQVIDTISIAPRLGTASHDLWSSRWLFQLVCLPALRQCFFLGDFAVGESHGVPAALAAQ